MKIGDRVGEGIRGREVRRGNKGKGKGGEGKGGLASVIGKEGKDRKRGKKIRLSRKGERGRDEVRRVRGEREGK